MLRKWRQPASLGGRGEAAAARFLRRRGYHIVARGEQCFGEIDVVAVDNRTVVFVEVKTRNSDLAGSPESAVDDEKQRRLTRAALGFLKRHDLLGNSARFDVVAVTWPNGQRRPRIEHIIDAFPAVGDEQRLR
jgi:putative endonuclease